MVGQLLRESRQTHKCYFATAFLVLNDCYVSIVLFQAAELNFPPAIYNLAVLHLEGKVVPKGK